MNSSDMSLEKNETESSAHDSLSIDRLKEILQTLSNIKSSQQDDIQQKLTDLRSLLLKVNAEPDETILFSENAMKISFYSQFIPKCTQSMLNYKNTNNINKIKIINQCLREIVILCAKNVSLNLSGLLETLGLILNPACEYYRSLERSLFRNNVEEEDSTSFGLVSLYSEFGEAGGFDRIYQMLQDDKQVKSTVFKIFIDCPPELKDKYLEKILIRVIDMTLDKITGTDIDFIINFYNVSLKPAWLVTKIWYFSWNITSNKGIRKLYPGLGKLIQNKFEKTLRGSEFEEHRAKSFFDYIEKLQQPGSLDWFSIEMIKEAIEFYPESSNFVQKVQRSSFVRLLCQYNGLLRMITNNLMFYKQSSFEKAKQPKIMRTIKLIMEFLDYVFTLAIVKEPFVSYSEFKDLWDALSCTTNKDQERKFCLEFVQKFCFLKQESSLSTEDLTLLFDKQICSKYLLVYSKETVEQNFRFFKTCFMSINKKLDNIIEDNVIRTQPGFNAVIKKHKSSFKLNVLPSQLKGIRYLWKFALEPDNDSQAKEAVQMIQKIYSKAARAKKDTQSIRENISICFEFLEDITKNSLRTESINKCLRCLNMVKFAIDKSEKSGFVGLKRHFDPVKKGSIILNIKNTEHKFVYEHRNAEVQVDVNETILDLRVKIGKRFRVRWNDFSLSRGRETLKNLYNNHTVSEVGLTSGEHITMVQRKNRADTRLLLVGDTSTLCPKMKEIVLEWFEEYSDNKKMTAEHLTALILRAFPHHFHATMQTARQMFTIFDKDRDCSLSFEEFISYIQKTCVDNKEFIWQHLYEFSYMNDLQKATDVVPEQLDILELPRYILATNNKYFQVLYSLLGLDLSIASQAWELISKLPTNLQLVKDMVSLKGIKNEPKNWNLLLDSDSPYKLLYNLVIVDQLMNIDEKDLAAGSKKGDSNIVLLLSENLDFAKSIKNWKNDFAVHRGIKHLGGILIKYSKNNAPLIKKIQESIITLILRVFAKCLVNPDGASMKGEPSLLDLINFVQDSISQENLSIHDEENNINLAIFQDLKVIFKEIFKDWTKSIFGDPKCELGRNGRKK